MQPKVAGTIRLRAKGHLTPNSSPATQRRVPRVSANTSPADRATATIARRIDSPPRHAAGRSPHHAARHQRQDLLGHLQQRELPPPVALNAPHSQS